MIHFTYPEPTDDSLYTEDTVENRLKHTLFLVAGDSYRLWCDHSKDSLYPPWDTRKGCRAYPALLWEQVGDGKMVQVGTFANAPIWVSFHWYRIEGQWVCFWEATSQVVDHRVVETWIEEHFKGRYDGGHRPARCNEGNFGHCLSAIKEANGKRS